MKTITTYIGFFLIIAGIIVMAGSDGMCGGHVCGPDMPPNTIGEMLMYAGVGLTMFVTGALIAIKGDQ